MKIGVIGGGAAGFFGAIAAADANPKAQVLLFEAGRETLAKVKISGGGRCNVTHGCFEPATLVQYYPRGGKVLRGVFSRFQPKDTIAWFELRGVKLKTEPDGRLFPTTDDSGTIVDCLMDEADRVRVKVKTSAGVKSVQRSATGFSIEMRNGETIQCDRILLATGSSAQGYQMARELGHRVIPTVPSLFTFNVRDRRLEGLAGVSVPDAMVKLQPALDANLGVNLGVNLGAKLEQSGPLLVTHWGLSGPAVLKLSAWGARALYELHYKTTLTVNWLPQSKPEGLRAELMKVKTQLAKKSVGPNCPVILPRRLWESLIAAAGIPSELRWSDVSKVMLTALLKELLQGEYAITGKGVFKDEFVTCGGVDLKEVDFKTMESRTCPGLYFAGEVLDIDGVTGGFNFQSAWSTGWIAGQAIGHET
ncbi:MAG: NAD(P)/FAD-dependent oxidoreductase [Alkalinema sp. FL-bin-369]|nr:NAD(P)/FAD-dependent oxidoreductase [Leptolyngbyaceae cyanobacterium LF-bin-369]